MMGSRRFFCLGQVLWNRPQVLYSLQSNYFSNQVRTLASWQRLSEGKRNLRRRLGMLEEPKNYYRRRGLALYESFDDNIDYQKFFKAFKMDDTFHSWFLIMELHLWMLLVRCKAEGEGGAYLGRTVVEFMWVDVKRRAVKLQGGSSSAINESLVELGDEFRTAVFLYDEGLLSTDMVLASAIWRRFFKENCNNPENVELLVRYIRRQIQVLDRISSEEFMKNAKITWTPFTVRKLSL